MSASLLLTCFSPGYTDCKMKAVVSLNLKAVKYINSVTYLFFILCSVLQIVKCFKTVLKSIMMTLKNIQQVLDLEV